MKIAFVETMRGFVTPKAGPSVPVDFNVRASGGAGGHFTLTGVVHAGPWVDETTCEGTLDLSVLPARMTYDVQFKATDGRLLRLHGAKHPSPFSPVKSMTVLPIDALRRARRGAGVRARCSSISPSCPASSPRGCPRPSRAHRQLEARRIAVARLAAPLRGLTKHADRSPNVPSSSSSQRPRSPPAASSPAPSAQHHHRASRASSPSSRPRYSRATASCSSRSTRSRSCRPARASPSCPSAAASRCSTRWRTAKRRACCSAACSRR